MIGVVLLTGLITYQIQTAAFGSAAFSIFGFCFRAITFVAIIGVSGYRILTLLWTFGASAERRSAMAQTAARLRVVNEASQMEFPNVPSDENITNSPGTYLAYRLPIVQLPAWQFFFSAAICLVFCSVATALFVTMWSRFQQQVFFDWLVMVPTIVFFFAGSWSIYNFLTHLLLHARLGPTSLEISDLPIFPGMSYQIHLSQSGHLTISSLELSLVCREEATFQQGTDVRTESKIVRKIDIIQDSKIHVEPEKPFEKEETVVFPVDAMHSFQSAGNLISWSFLVRGVIEGWPEFERRFRVIVRPNSISPT